MIFFILHRTCQLLAHKLCSNLNQQTVCYFLLPQKFLKIIYMIGNKSINSNQCMTYCLLVNRYAQILHYPYICNNIKYSRDMTWQDVMATRVLQPTRAHGHLVFTWRHISTCTLSWPRSLSGTLSKWIFPVNVI